MVVFSVKPGEVLAFIPKQLENLVLGWRESSRGSTIAKGAIYKYIVPFAIVDPRGFDAVQN